MSKLTKYIRKHLKSMGTQVAYSALLLFYASQQKETPRWAKSTILGALGYLLSPIDSVPDLTPFIGFTDDMGVLMFAAVTIACYINNDVRELARKRLLRLLPTASEEDFVQVDARL